MAAVGLALHPERYDALTVECIPERYWRGESKLYKSKWWDYRPMHPMKATYHFVEAYKSAYKRAFSRRADSEAARFLKVFAHDDFLEGAASTRTALWLARQAADEIGCPYDFFCARAMHYAERRDWAMLPRPQAMYSTKPMYESDMTIRQHVEKCWIQKCKDEVMYSRDDFYHFDSFVNNAHQREHQRFLVERLATAPNAPILAAHLMFDAKVLHPSFVETALPDGSTLVERAKNYAM